MGVLPFKGVVAENWTCFRCIHFKRKENREAVGRRVNPDCDPALFQVDQAGEGIVLWEMPWIGLERLAEKMGIGG